MKSKFNKRYLLIAVYAFLTVCACVSFYLLFVNFEGVRNFVSGFLKIFTPIVYGFLIAYILNPIVNFIERLLKKNKKLKLGSDKVYRRYSMILAYLLAVAFIAVFLLIITPNLTASVNLLIGNISRYTANLNNLVQSIIQGAQKYVEDITFLSDQLENITKWFEGIVNELAAWAKNLLPQAINIVANLSKGIINVFIGIVVSIYMLSGKERFIAQIKKFSLAYFRQDHVERAIVFSRNVNEIVSGYLNGVIIDSCLVGVVTFVLLSLFGISFPLLISVISAVTNIIPFFGPFIGAIPSGFILLMIDPMQAVIYAILVLVIQQIDGNIIAPKILGSSTGIPSIWVVVAILVGSDLFGFWGMLLGVPVFAVFYQLLKVNVGKRLEAKGMPQDTEHYLTYMHSEPKVLLMDKNETRSEDEPRKLVEKIFAIIVKVIKFLWKYFTKALKFIVKLIRRFFKWLKAKIDAKNEELKNGDEK